MKILKSIQFNNREIEIAEGDITECDVDALVNAANSYLQHGGGVAGTIARKGGPIIQQESNQIGYVAVGDCAITSGGRLKAPYVVHAVGPRYGEGNEEEKLRLTVVNVLKMATSRGFSSIAMPAISAGIFGFPKEACTGILFGETRRFLLEQDTSLKKVIFCLIDKDIIQYFLKELQRGTE